MLNNFKVFFKKYFIIIIFIALINIPFIIMGTVRTNYGLTLEGVITEFDSVVEVDTNYETKGSFNTTAVVSMSKSTIFQNLITEGNPNVEKYKISDSAIEESDANLWFGNRIMFASSIHKSVIVAYSYAMQNDPSIKLDYSFDGFYVTNKEAGSRLSIGDRIVGVSKKSENYENNYYFTEPTKYVNALNSLQLEDKILINHSTLKLDSNYNVVLKEGIEEIYLSENEALYLEDEDRYYLAASLNEFYNVDYNTISPKIKFNSSSVGGPSGGLMQTLSIYNSLVEEDITHGYKIAGTGTISLNGNVGAIGGIKEKIPTAIHNGVDIFLCVSANYDTAKEKYDSISDSSKMKLVRVSTFKDALDFLKEVK